MVEPALRDSAVELGLDVSPEWVAYGDIESHAISAAQGIFVAPASPVDDDSRLIGAIKFARESGVPCIGTCGGFQKIIAEYALNELSYDRIEHQEISPSFSDPLFSELQCSLVGEKSEVLIEAGTMAASVYGVLKSEESFFCRYGINPSHIERITSKSLRISATGINQEARIVEHIEHPFFVGCLFVPQVCSSIQSPHPLITAFLEHSAGGQNRS
ncbi:MAG: CTP synthase [Verrucomicrobiota bacterium]